MPDKLTESNDLEAGFTLLELMVALTLLSFLTLLLYESAHIGITVWHRTSVSLTELTKSRNAQATMSRDIEKAYPRHVDTGSVSYIDFDGGPDQLSMLTADRSHPGLLSRVTIGAKGGPDSNSLIRASAPELAKDKISTTTLLDHVQTIQFSYYGAVDNQPPAWFSTWKNRTSLPRLVRVQITVKGHEDASILDWIVAPRLTADVSCILDLATSTCRGL